MTNAIKEDRKPLLVYDGDCGFCVYSARYWQKLTNDKVDYKPYQEVADHYPDIPIEAFQRAVQYISPEGKVASAAEASFLTLSHAPGRRFLLSLYRKLPGFAFISEKTYAFIAAHRSFFYCISLFFWGRVHEPSRYQFVSWIFLRALGLIFFAAFFSFATQSLGLIGSQGILPLSNFVNAVLAQFNTKSYWLAPMVFWLGSSDFIIQAVCWSGVLLSVLLIFNILPRMCLIFLYVLYLSLTYGGQAFMTYQWDMQLLETSVIAIFLIGTPTLGIWLLRWLLFRFIFVSGLVKIMSGDPTWQNLSTLSYYFFTQPLPTPLAWYAQQLPLSILSAATFIVLIIELVIPFLLFLPRRIRFFSACSILLLQATILITGNYNFFNLLTILLCLSAFDDAALRKIIPKRLTHLLTLRPQHHTYKITRIASYTFAVITILISIVQFNLRFGMSVPAPAIAITSSIAPLLIVNTYGPFSVITTKRYEIIIEGSDDGIDWKEYSFKYKPGDIFRRPLWNIPHQPRLDWQMWFAALTQPNNIPWFTNFLRRLLENSPPVTALLENNPFPDKPPLFIRAQFYDYRFTTSEEKTKSGAWWERELVGVYFPQARL